jgi:uncharacterized phiE125 gp8 family phage protein
MSWCWDRGVSSRSRLVTAPVGLPLDVAYLRDKALRTAGETVEDELIEAYIGAATEAAEHDTGRSLMPQTWQLLLGRFPAGPIVLPKLPVRAVTLFEYVDEDGVLQTLLGSPPEYVFRGSGEWSRAELSPLYGEVWPSTRGEDDAVRITYTTGYDATAEIPKAITAGIALLVGELYNHRTLSVHEVHNTPATVQLPRFWKQVP